MYDAGAKSRVGVTVVSAQAAKANVSQKPVDQRTCGVSPRRVHYHASGLVDDHQVFVLPNHLDGNGGVGLSARCRQRTDGVRDPLSSMNGVFGTGTAAIDRDAPFGYPALHGGT